VSTKVECSSFPELISTIRTALQPWEMSFKEIDRPRKEGEIVVWYGVTITAYHLAQDTGIDMFIKVSPVGGEEEVLEVEIVSIWSRYRTDHSTEKQEGYLLTARRMTASFQRELSSHASRA